MRGAFRFTPPALAAGTLTRPRLVRALRGRWEHRVTVVVGGAGLGKTTLMAQTLSENLLAPRGRDVWLGLDAIDDDAALLGRDLLEALGGPGDATDPVGAVAASVWSHAPSPMCLVLDDLHRLDPSAAGFGFINDLIPELPENGHLLVTSRTRPPLRLARLEADGSVLRVDEADLRMTPDELDELASTGGRDSAALEGTAGWPALAQLVLRAGPNRIGDFVWEEVLEPLGDEGRKLFAIVCDLGAANDALASAAADRPVDLSREIGSVPLVASNDDGWWEPHALWRSVSAVHLDAATRTGVRERAALFLMNAGRYEDAFELFAGGELWHRVPELFRRACHVGARPAVTVLDRWLRVCPDDVLGSPGGRLAIGVRAEIVDPVAADGPLTDATTMFRDAGDLEGEVTAIAHLGRLAWWRQDLVTLAKHAPRVAELAAHGHPAAIAMDRIARAFVHDLQGNDAGIWDAMAEVHQPSGDAWWDAVTAWMRSMAQASQGHYGAALAALDDLAPTGEIAIEMLLQYARGLALWAAGDIDWVTRRGPELLAAIEEVGVTQNIALAASAVSLSLSYLGDGEAARRCIERGQRLRGEAQINALTQLALAEASIQVMSGDEPAASETLRAALAAAPIEHGTPRRVWRTFLPLTYVLVPETRATWNAAPLAGQHVFRRDLAAAVVVGRGQEADDTIDRLDFSNMDVVRTALHHCFAAELAVRLHQRGRSEGTVLLDALGPAGRQVVRQISVGPLSLAAPAAQLLTATPAPPKEPLKVSVLGSLELHRGTHLVDAAELRRERVRALLCYLVMHRTTSRDAIMAALWTDLDERAAANNLRVTLSMLNRLLEPDRPDNEPAYFVRTDGNRVRLVVSDLDIDADNFDDHFDRATRAEHDATPSVALEHYRAAVACYRGDLYADLNEAEWFSLDRERYRLRYVESAVRAAQLLAATGQLGAADDLANVALAADPWCETGAAVLLDCALRRNDRSAARRHLDRCIAIAAELGVEPSEETRRLQRQLRSPA